MRPEDHRVGLTEEQAAILLTILRGEVPDGRSIQERIEQSPPMTHARLAGMMLETYLTVLHLTSLAERRSGAEADKLRSQLYRQRRKCLLSSKRALGRWPSAEDFDKFLSELRGREIKLGDIEPKIAADLEVLKQPIPRRSKEEVFDEKMKKLEARIRKYEKG